MAPSDLTNYMNAMHSNKKLKLNKVELSMSDHKKALTKQGKKCISCKRDLNPLMTKYIKDSKTKELQAICANCAIKIIKPISAD